jgi:hypothetical protein
MQRLALSPGGDEFATRREFCELWHRQRSRRGLPDALREAAFRCAASSIKAGVVAAVLAIAGCAGLSAPTAQSIAGLSPAGSVTINEDFVTGLGAGTGTLYYQGQSYPFKLAGTVVGPGGGVAKINASGEVYKLASLADFPGRYTQSTGPAGLSTTGGSDLWLQNSTGVIMHLQGTSTGAMLTLGRDEIFIRMAQ